MSTLVIAAVLDLLFSMSSAIALGVSTELGQVKTAYTFLGSPE